MENTCAYILENLNALPQPLMHAIMMTLSPEDVEDMMQQLLDVSKDDSAAVPAFIGKEIDWCRWAIYRDADEDAPVPFVPNPAFEDLLAAFVWREKGKVAQARKLLRKRFENCSYAQQRLMLDAFMKSGSKADVVWCARHLCVGAYWREEYFAVLLERWEADRGNHVLARPIIAHASVPFLEDAVLRLKDALPACRVVCRMMVQRLAEDPAVDVWAYGLPLSDTVYVCAKTGRKVSHHLALEALYGSVAELLERGYGWTAGYGPDHTLRIGLDNDLLLWSLGKTAPAGALVEYASWLLEVAYVVQSRMEEIAVSAAEAVPAALREFLPDNFVNCNF